MQVMGFTVGIGIIYILPYFHSFKPYIKRQIVRIPEFCLEIKCLERVRGMIKVEDKFLMRGRPAQMFFQFLFFGFKVNISAFVLPLIGLSIPLLFTKSSRNKSIGEFFIGFSFLFMGLDMISTYVPDLQSNPEMFEFLQRYTSMGFGSVLNV